MLKYWNNGMLGFSTIPVFHRSNFPCFRSDLRFVNVTPAPVLARFEGLDDRVAGCVKMFSGVPIG